MSAMRTAALFCLLLAGATCQRNHAPSAPVVSGPGTGYTHSALSLEVQATDPDRQAIAYQFEWGDSSDTAWTDFYLSGESFRQRHTYLSPGTFTAKARAKDAKELLSDWSTPLQIVVSSHPPNPPSLPLGPASGYTDSTYSFSSYATDPRGDRVAIRFDWGDGISDWSGWVPGETVVSMSHTFGSAGVFQVSAQAKDTWGGISDWSASLPVTVVTYEVWDTIMTENFEGTFPGTTWDLSGNPTWGAESSRSYQGSRSGWCAGTGRQPGEGYAPNMDAWMIYGPFSLVGASGAVLSLYRWVETKADSDFSWFGASIDGSEFSSCNEFYGDGTSWEAREQDLSQVPGLGNLCGLSRVWIAFGFRSDGTDESEGAYWDNIVLEKRVYPPAPGGDSALPRASGAGPERYAVPEVRVLSERVPPK
jgi:hypothetical protein